MPTLTCTWTRTGPCRDTSVLSVKYCLSTFLPCFTSTLQEVHPVRNSQCTSKNSVKTASQISRVFFICFLFSFFFFSSSRYLLVCSSFTPVFSYSWIQVDWPSAALPHILSFMKKGTTWPSPRTSPTLPELPEITFYGSRIISGSKHPRAKLLTAQQEQQIQKLELQIIILHLHKVN